MSKTVRNFSKFLEFNSEDLIQYLDLALEVSNLGIWDWYLDDNSFKFDRRWAEMLGLDYEKIDMELETWESRVHPDDLERCFADIKAYMDGETDFYENIHRMKHNDGHWVYILDRGRFSAWDEEGKPTRFTGTHFDITSSERYRQKLGLFFDKSTIGFAFCDMDGRILEANPAYLNIVDYTLDEITKLSYWELTPRKYEKDEELQLISLNNKKRYGPYRKEYIKKDGTLVPVELNGFIVEDYDGQKGIWSTVQDISEKARLESDVLRNSKLASIGVLAAGVAHEINNPLTIIKGFFDKLKKDYSDDVNFMKTAENIDKGIERIIQIVSGLSTVISFDSSQQIEFDLIKTVLDVVSDFERNLKDDLVEFTLDVPKGLSFLIDGNEGKLYHSILNLLTNANDAVSANEKGIISFSLMIENSDAIIVVKDNGHGMNSEVQSQIFDPFFTTKKINEGKGIGLFIVFNYVKSLQGDISVKSVEGKGTEFTIRLPGKVSTSSYSKMTHR